MVVSDSTNSNSINNILKAKRGLDFIKYNIQYSKTKVQAASLS